MWVFVATGLLLLLTAGPVQAQRAAVGEPWKRYVDIRPIESQPSFEGGQPSFWIAFAARRGVPGHAFVLFFAEDGRRQMTTVDAYGMHPTVQGAAALASVLGPVPGALRDEIMKKELDGCCSWTSPDVLGVFEVDSTAFARARAVRDQWNSSAATYRPTEQDCVTFVQSIGGSLGFKMPNRGPFNADPIGYLKSFLNGIDGKGIDIRIGRQDYRLYAQGASEPFEGSVTLATPGGDDSKRSARSTFYRRPGEHPLMGESSNRPRANVLETSDGRVTRQFTRFDDGDVFTTLYHTPPDRLGNPPSQYRYENGTIVNTVPDLMLQNLNVQPLPWGNGIYAGDWLKGLPHGNGTWKSPAITYSGQWDSGQPHGKGNAAWPDGTTYDGTWQNGQFHGAGSYRWANGETFVGVFSQGIPQNGTRTDLRGQRHEGVGERISRERPEKSDSDSDLRGRWVEKDREGRTIREGEIRGMEIRSGKK